eukprot:jgi/Orpsp1_1/1183192/evm.model.c7180000084226.1
MKFLSIAQIAVLLISFAASGKFVNAKPSGSDNENIKVCFDYPKGWYTQNYAYIYKMEGYKVTSITSWPGLSMKLESPLNCVSFSKDYEGGYIIFSDTKNQVPGFPEKGFIIKANALYDENGYKSSLDDVKSTEYLNPMNISLKFYTEWENPLLYVSTEEDGNWAYSYGVSMIDCENEKNCKTIDIRTPNTLPKFQLAFNNNEEWLTGDLYITESGNYVVKDGVLSKTN